jgi:hypothetical protein
VSHVPEGALHGHPRQDEEHGRQGQGQVQEEVNQRTGGKHEKQVDAAQKQAEDRLGFGREGGGNRPDQQ